MKNYLKGLTIAAVIALLFATSTDAQGNEYTQTIWVDIFRTEKFTEPQNPNKDDRIIVENRRDDREIFITGWEFDDPTRDRAILDITGDTEAVVIRRGGVGATYKLLGEYLDGGKGGGVLWFGRSYPWWKAEDEIVDGTLVLKDTVSGVEVGDAGFGASGILPCRRGANDKGHVVFKLHVEEGAYNWVIFSGEEPGENDPDGLLTEPSYENLLSLNPGNYTLKMTADGGFEREIEFGISTVRLTDMTVYVWVVLDDPDNPSKSFKSPIEFLKDLFVEYVIDSFKKPFIQALEEYGGTWLKFRKWLVPSVALTSAYVHSIKYEVQFDAYKSDGVWIENLTVEVYEDGPGGISGLLLRPYDVNELGELLDTFANLLVQVSDEIKAKAEEVYD